MHDHAHDVRPAGLQRSLNQDSKVPWASRVVFWPLLAVVLLAPLPFASVNEWAWAPLTAITAAILSVWVVLLIIGKLRVAVPAKKVAFTGTLFLLVVIWIVAQSLPYTPISWHHPAWHQAAQSLGTTVLGSISLDKDLTYSALTRLLWYVTVFWLSLQLCRTERLARQALNALALAAFVYAFYGLFVEFTGIRMVLWTKKYAYFDNVTSTFINRNSYATYAGIGLICLTAVMARRFASVPVVETTFAARMVDTIELVFARGWHFLVAWAAIVTALLLTDSRAGVVAGFIGLFTFLGSLALSRAISRKAVLSTLALLLTAVTGFLLMSGDAVLRRMAKTIGISDIRFELYDITLGIIAKFPLVGTGYGTFSRAYQMYHPNTPRIRVPVHHAHNTYLENALELGIVAASALTLAVAYLAIMCLRGIRRRRQDIFYPAVGVGASVLVGAHSLVDFSLQIPAVATTYAFLMGLACAQSWSKREGV